MLAIKAESITAGYSKIPVIEDVNLQGEAGAIVAIIGPNGAGKSTFLKAVFGLLPYSTGHVSMADKDVSGWPTYRLVREGVAYVPQANNLHETNVFTAMSVRENLEVGAYIRTKGVRDRISEVLELFPDLAAAEYKEAGKLSGGQRTMLAIARALMVEPKVILLDEPSAGLSPMYTSIVWDQIRRIAAAGTAVVVVEQQVDLALSRSDWVYVLVNGKNRMDGPATAVAQQNLADLFLGGGVSGSP
jgi:ABC-type branched-subunit amino acid transport system ATPase component